MTQDASDPRPVNARPALRCTGFLLAIIACVQAAGTIGTLRVPEVYRKDLLQDYLAARAILDGQDPYRPMSALSAEYLPPIEGALAFPHPTPHPPAALLLTVPLGLTTYPRAAAAWLALEYLLLGTSCALIAWRVWGMRSATAAGALMGLALWTAPVRDDLVLGQFTVVILALFVASHAALTARRARLGGLLLGAAVSLKFLGWPVVAYYAWRRRWRVVLASAGVLLAVHGLAACVMPGAVAKYYTQVAPHASADYSASDLNISVWTLGQHVFGGLYSQATVNHVTAPPLIDRPALAQRAGSIAALAWFLVCLRSASKRDDETGFLVMLCASAVLNPIAWDIYLALLLLPLSAVGVRLAQRSWPRGLALVFAGLVVGLIVIEAPRDLLLGKGPERPVLAIVGLASALPLLWPAVAAWLVAASAQAHAFPPRMGHNSYGLAQRPRKQVGIIN